MREPAFLPAPAKIAVAFDGRRAVRARRSLRAYPSRPRACASPPSRPPAPLAPRPLAPRPRAPLSRGARGGVPALLDGPEAVLGIVLAAAALLADFAAGLARLATGGDVDVAAKRVRAADAADAADVDGSIEGLQRALDASKRALAETEASLDATVARAKSAEAAMAGIGDSRDRLQRALDEAAKAEMEVGRIQERLRVERGERERVVGQVGEREGERERVEEERRRKENEVGELRAMLEEVRGGGETALREHERRESELVGEVGQKEKELGSVRRESERLESEAREMEKTAQTMSEQVSAAALALEETRQELELAERELEKRKEEKQAVEEASAAVVALSAEKEKLKEELRGMEGTVSDMQQELRTRDKIVEEVSLETDLLASLLAARDAELHETQRKLESAMGSEDAGGGDADESELSLEEIKSTVSAEQLTLRAEIAQAELAKSDLGADDLDPLDRVEREMGAKRELLQARLTRAQASAKRQEYEKRRKQGAVDDVLRSGDREQAADTLGVARQKQGIADAEAKPRARRRGRPRKKAAGGDDGADGGKGGPAAKKAAKK